MKFIFAFFAVLSAGAAAAPCNDFNTYRPETFVRAVTEQLRDRGVAVSRVANAGLATGRLGIMRDGSLYGQVATRGDVRTATSEALFYDPAGSLIASVTERTTICPESPYGGPTGRCKSIEIRTELDNADKKSKPAFTLALTPAGRLLHYRYGELVAPYDWKLQFIETFQWLRGTLQNPRQPVPFLVKNASERFHLALASDAIVSPYADRISISRGRDRWILRGVVPSNLVYGRAIDIARASGFRYLDPQLTINTGTTIKDLYLLGTVMACYRG